MIRSKEELLSDLETANKVVVGVVADTHVPDRVDRLHPLLIETLNRRQVDIILHAGDICHPKTITELETVAPVWAVRGNRDFYFMKTLPVLRTMVLAGHRLALVHGHGRWRHYFINKIRMMLEGYDLNIFLPSIFDSIPESDVIVFGHTHRPVNLWYDQHRLLFNPGSSSMVEEKHEFPSIGILRLEKGRQPQGEVIALLGEKLKNRHWTKL